MTLKTPDFLTQILDDYSSGVTNSLEVLAQRNGVSVRSLFVWMRDKDLTLDYMGRSGITFGQAMTMARNVMKQITVGRTLEDYVLNGRRVEVWHHGRPQFEEDEELVKLGEDFVRDVLGLPDMYRRDLNGNRILATRVEYAPAQLIEKYAASNMQHVYGNKSEVTMRGNVNLGVTTIGTQRPLPPKVLEQMGGSMITETVKLAPPVIDTPTEVFEAVNDEDEEAAPMVAALPERTIRDKPAVRETSPPQTGILKPNADTPPPGPMTPLQRDLWERVQAARAKAQQA